GADQASRKTTGAEPERPRTARAKRTRAHSATDSAVRSARAHARRESARGRREPLGAPASKPAKPRPVADPWSFVGARPLVRSARAALGQRHLATTSVAALNGTDLVLRNCGAPHTTTSSIARKFLQFRFTPPRSRAVPSAAPARLRQACSF